MRRRKTVSFLVLSMLMASSVGVYGAQKGKSSATVARAKTAGATRGALGATRAKTTSSALRAVKSSKNKTAPAPNATSLATESLLTNIQRFVGQIYGETVKYGKSYALQDMLTPQTWQYYYDNGSSNVSGMNSSSSILDEQFCFGPYMTLVGRDGTRDFQVYTHKSENQVKCVALEPNTVYTLSLIEATDDELLSALTTTAQNNLPNDGRRFAYVARSGSPIDTMFFSTEAYFNVSKIVDEIKTKLGKMRESCGTFAESMDKLKNLLGWTSVTGGVGMASSGAALGLGIYDIKKTKDMQKDLKDEENLRTKMVNALKQGLWYKAGEDSPALWYRPEGEFDESCIGADNDKPCPSGVRKYRGTDNTCYCKVVNIEDWEKVTNGVSKFDGDLGGINIRLFDEWRADANCWKKLWDGANKTNGKPDSDFDGSSECDTFANKITWRDDAYGTGFSNFIHGSLNDGNQRKLDELNRYVGSCRSLLSQANHIEEKCKPGSDGFSQEYRDLGEFTSSSSSSSPKLADLFKAEDTFACFNQESYKSKSYKNCSDFRDEQICCGSTDTNCCTACGEGETGKKIREVCEEYEKASDTGVNARLSKFDGAVQDVRKKLFNVSDTTMDADFESKVKAWKNLSDETKKQYALPKLYKKMLEETDKALGYQAKVDQLNALSAEYLKREKNIEANAKLTKGLDIGQVALSSVSLVSSGVSVGLSIAAFNEVDKALSNLKTCRTDMQNFKDAYDLYMTEYNDEYKAFKEAKKKESGVAYDFKK